MDVTSMLNMYAMNATSEIDKVQKLGERNLTKKAGETTVGETSFSAMLGDEIAELSERKSLIDALDGTVLRGVTNPGDLSIDMLKSGSGQMMMQELMKGQYASIITADPEEEDEKKKESLTESLLDNLKPEQKTTDINDLLERMQTLVDNKTAK